jgi:hypothetical protein
MREVNTPRADGKVCGDGASECKPLVAPLAAARPVRGVSLLPRRDVSGPLPPAGASWEREEKTRAGPSRRGDPIIVAVMPEGPAASRRVSAAGVACRGSPVVAGGEGARDAGREDAGEGAARLLPSPPAAGTMGRSNPDPGGDGVTAPSPRTGAGPPAEPWAGGTGLADGMGVPLALPAAGRTASTISVGSSTSGGPSPLRPLPPRPDRLPRRPEVTAPVVAGGAGVEGASPEPPAAGA